MTPTETTANRPVSELVIEAISDSAGVDPLEFDVPLGDVIDPDALDSLFTSQFGEPRDGIRVEFTYEEFHVTVVPGDDGEVSVDVTPAGDRTSADSSVERQQA